MEGQKGWKHVDEYSSSFLVEGSACLQYGNSLKPAIVQDYNNYSICKYLEMEKRIVFSPPGPFISEWFYSYLLWLQIIPQGFQTCLGQRPNKRGWKGALTSTETNAVSCVSCTKETN
jgi:hypothetical protein